MTIDPQAIQAFWTQEEIRFSKNSPTFRFANEGHKSDTRNYALALKDLPTLFLSLASGFVY
jgi:hypothetical protein